MKSLRGTYAAELAKTSLKTRNRLRSILTLKTNKAAEVLNAVRKHSTAAELAQVDRVLWASPVSDADLVPALFPALPQVSENYVRLDPLALTLQLGVLEHHSKVNINRLRGLMSCLAAINRAIIERRFEDAASLTVDQVTAFGYSHIALRKAAFIRAVAPQQHILAVVDTLLEKAGFGENKFIATSLVHCYQEEKPFLSMKRSVLGVSARGDANKFTRDISRIPFHPHTTGADDLRDLVQSALQSSLIDALVVAKFNSTHFDIGRFPYLAVVFAELEQASPSLDEVANLQPAIDDESELLLYKRSSAWLESADVSRYRLLLDNFYDTPDVPYINVNEDLCARVGALVNIKSIDDLATSVEMIRRSSRHLRHLENLGTATRSSLFNYCLHVSQGVSSVKEDNLIELMTRTTDLARTIPTAFAKTLADSSSSDLSKLILYLLIAKRSRNEKDDFRLRRLSQQMAQRHFSGRLLDLVSYLESKSSTIACYAYELFTEDFIAKLFHLIGSASGITETRADLHRWMGQHTGDKTYLDRARTLLIDHQINKVRNEINDNRIYVDVARFREWINDELFRDLVTALSSIEHKGIEEGSPDAILPVLIERCYSTFCTHKAFGISSYLGRRIRHGTFKGHLYSGVTSIEREDRFYQLLSDSNVAAWWADWKDSYESKVDGIIRDRLHVATPAKREGLLKTGLSTPKKAEIVTACAKALTNRFAETNSSEATAYLITDYCWRLAEVDLTAFNAYLKGQRRTLSEGLLQIATVAPFGLRNVAEDFFRSAERAITERLMAMQMWFKRPITVSPKASLSLLYKAVVQEVASTYPSLSLSDTADLKDDIELFGGAYHVLYDSFYVVVFNAAKHGKVGGAVIPKFWIVADTKPGHRSLYMEISSELSNDDDESEVLRRLNVGSDLDIDNAQIYENRSGVPKLYHLQGTDPLFAVRGFRCEQRRLFATLSYRLEY